MKKIALIGAPNTGKTTLFNSLTKSAEHVGNWHGVTTHKKEKTIKYDNDQFCIIDLAGTYSLNPYSLEEYEPSQFVANSTNEILVCVCDSENIKRGLYILLQILELDKPCIFAINIFKENKKIKNIEKTLKKHLNIEIISQNFIKNQDFSLFFQKINNIKDYKNNFDYLNKYDIRSIENIFCKINKSQARFLSIRFLEGNDDYKNFKNLDKNDIEFLNELRKKDTAMMIAKARYDFINKLFSKFDNYSKKIFKANKKSISKNKEILKNYKKRLNKNKIILKNNKKIFKNNEKVLKSNKKQEKYKNNCFFNNEKQFRLQKLDNILLNKYLAFPLFLLIMLVVFYLTFSSVGAFFSSCLENLMGNIEQSINALLTKHCNEQWVKSLICDGIINGVGSIIVFLPQVVLLFFFLGLLEESGYLSRIAYLLEGVFSKIGLSGKSVFTWLMGFGCTATAVLTAKNLNNHNDKIKTVITTAFMPCSAKLPVLAVLGGAFFGANNVFAIFLCYVFSASIGMLISCMLDKTILPQQKDTFILEFPRYQQPLTYNLAKSVINNSQHFLKKVSGFLLVFSVLIWLLQSLDFSFNYVKNTENVSIMQSLSQFLSPVFAPIGLGNWGIVSCLLSGLVAKELIVSTMGIINGVESGLENATQTSLLLTTSSIHLSLPSCLSLITFVLLYPPCMATFSTMKTLIGAKYTWFGYAIMTIIAYVSSYIIYRLALIFCAKGLLFTLIIVLSIIILSYISVKLINMIFNGKKIECTLCKKCCNCKAFTDKNNIVKINVNKRINKRKM